MATISKIVFLEIVTDAFMGQGVDSRLASITSHIEEAIQDFTDLSEYLEHCETIVFPLVEDETPGQFETVIITSINRY